MPYLALGVGGALSSLLIRSMLSTRSACRCIHSVPRYYVDRSLLYSDRFSLKEDVPLISDLRGKGSEGAGGC